MINDLLLLSGNDIPFPEAQLVIHNPSIKEIGLIGEEAFFNGCAVLNFSKENLSNEDRFNLRDLSEIEILSAPQSNSSIVVPDPIDTTPKFDIVLSSAGSFKGNETFELLCEVKNIKATYGIVAVDFVVSYNKSAFTPLYPSGNDLSSSYIKTAPKSGSTLLWEDIGTYCDTANGKVYMRFAHKTAENGDGTKKDGELVFKILFTAKVSTGSYDFVASGCRGTDPGSSNYKKLTEVYANGSSFTATAASFSSQLVPAVSGVEIENGYVYGIPHRKTVDQVKAMFEGNVTLISSGNNSYVSTGTVVISEDGNEAAVIIILGDVDGFCDHVLFLANFASYRHYSTLFYFLIPPKKRHKILSQDKITVKYALSFNITQPHRLNKCYIEKVPQRFFENIRFIKEEKEKNKSKSFVISCSITKGFSGFSRHTN